MLLTREPEEANCCVAKEKTSPAQMSVAIRFLTLLAFESSLGFLDSPYSLFMVPHKNKK